MRHLLFAALACLFPRLMFAQPVNDNACDATLISVDSVCSGNAYSNAQATLQMGEPADCWTEPNSVWFKFAAPASGAVRIVSMSSEHIRKSLYAVGDCADFGSFATLQCTGFGEDIWHSGLTPGAEYWLRIQSETTAASFCLEVQGLVSMPANDAACAAALLQVDSACTGDPFVNTTATRQTGEPNSCGYEAHTIWFKFMAPGTGAVRVSTTGQDLATSMFAVAGSCGNFANFTELGCAWNAPLEVGGLMPDSVYYIQSTNLFGSTDTFCLSLETIFPPANDSACAATMLVVNSGCADAPYSLAAATSEAGEPDSCYSSVQTAWFKFVVPSTGAVEVGTWSPDFWTFSELYTVGDCGDFSSYVFQNCAGYDDYFQAAGLTPGDTAFVKVGTNTGSTGAYCITVDSVFQWFADFDGDGYGDPFDWAWAGTQPTDYVLDSTDCDGAAANIHPAATETCDGYDEDCNGQIDDGVGTYFFADTDGDGFGNAGLDTLICAANEDFVADNTDCDDANAAIFPNAPELCDGLDNDCDGQIDGTMPTWFADADGDGFGNAAIDTVACDPGAGWVLDNTDCDDAAANINPDETETCDNLDNNCDGQTDEGVLQTFYADADGDTFGSFNQTQEACSAPSGYVSNFTDCDDNDAANFPGRVGSTISNPFIVNSLPYSASGDNSPTGCWGNEIGYNSHDVWYKITPTDCGTLTASLCGATNFDSYITLLDADENYLVWNNDFCGTRSQVSFLVDSNTTYYVVVEGVSFAAGQYSLEISLAEALPTHWADADGDGFGDPAQPAPVCTQPTGYVSNNLDCNDANPNIKPGATETCNLIDEDCDGTVDDGFDMFTYYADADGDSWGSTTVTVLACVAPPGYTYLGYDCNDANATVHPYAPELCDSLDNDCDGDIDEGAVLYFFLDADADGYGEGFGYSQNFVQACSQPAGYAPIFGDCDDANPDIHTGAAEVCNGLDDDCDGGTDEGVGQWFYADNDGDGYGNSFYSQFACTAPSGYVSNFDDCHDGNADIHPGAPEICVNNLDDDCNGTIDINPDISPASPLICGNGSLTLTASGGTSYAWSNGPATASNAVAPASTTTYTVTVSLSAQCSAVLSRTVTVSNDQAIGSFGSRVPASGAVNVPNSPVLFTWSPVPNAEHFDLFVWPANSTRPEVPTASNLSTFSHTLPLVAATAYKWQLRAFNDCHSAWSDSLTFTTVQLPDLVVHSLSVPATVVAGQPFSFSWQTQNIGQAGTGASVWSEKLWISGDSTFGPGDFLLGTWFNASYLNPSETYTQTRTANWYPNFIGAFYLLMETGSGGINEVTRTNNWRHTFVTATLAPQPDLQIESVAAPTSAFGGDSVAVSAVIKNTGNLAVARSYSDGIYLSDSAYFDLGHATLLGYHYAGGANQTLQPEESYAFTQNVRLPHSAYGPKWLYVVADALHKKPELSEGNNIGTTAQAIQIALLPPADLQPTALNAPASALSGQSLSVSATIHNNGAANYGEQTTWTDRFYLSQNATLDNSDIPLGFSLHENGIAAGGSYTASVVCQLPQGLSGNYYLLVKADDGNQVFEYTFENNNVLASAAPLNIAIAPSPDLVVTAVLPSTNAMTEQQAYSLSWTTKNQGNAPANGQLVEAVYLSQDPDWDGVHYTGITKLERYQRTADLLPGDSMPYSKNFLLPNLPMGGTWYIYVRADADNQFFEANSGEGNNLLRSAAITVTERFADLEITAFAAPATALSGSTITAQWSVSNSGQVPTSTANWEDLIYLSPDATWSSDDALLSKKARAGGLAPNATYDASLLCPLPNGTSGSLYLLLKVANGRLSETNDGNAANNFTALPITVNLAPSPDLVVTSLSMPSPVFAGESYWAHFSVKNQGASPLNGTAISDRLFFVKTTDQNWDDYPIGFRAVPRTLAPQASYSDSVLVTVPVYANGYHYLTMRTDRQNAVYEYNGETNNDYIGTAVGHPIGSQLPIAVLPASESSVNLVVTEVTAPDSVMLGDWADVQFEIKNTSATGVTRSVSNADYFSKDGAFNAATDRLQRTEGILLNLAAGDSVTRTLSAPLLTLETGEHRAVARTNVAASLAENNFADNIAFAAAQTHVGVRSLALETPTVFALNQDNWHYYQFAAAADLDLLVTLKALNGVNNGHLFIGHERVPTPDDFDFTDDGANGTRTAIVPSCAAGTYIVLAQVLAPNATQPQTEILVRALPFSVVSASPNRLGRGRVTTTVVGAGFTENTTTWELRQGGTTFATGTPGQFFNSMKTKVRWDLTNVPVGTYDLVASKPGGQTAVLAGGIVVEEAKAPHLSIVKNLPSQMLVQLAYTWSFSFINTGNVDIDAAECPVYTESIMSITKINKSSNILTRDEFFPEALAQPPVEERGGYYRVMAWMKDLAPGEAGYLTLTVEGFPRIEGVLMVPLRVGAIPYTKEQFLRKQAYVIELQRQRVLNHPNEYLGQPEMLALAANQTTFRDSMLAPYVVNGFVTRDDIAAADFHTGFYDFYPALSQGKATYQNTSFAPGGTYLWTINLDKALGGAAGTDPGWDLVHATGTIDMAATAADPFTVILASKSPCGNNLEHLTTWEPWRDYRWPIAVADGGWQNFAPNKIKLETTFFANTNDLCGGHLQLELSGDTLYVHFVHRDRLPGEPGCNGGPGLCGYPGGTGGQGGDGAAGGNGGYGQNGNDYGPASPGGKGGKGGLGARGGDGGKGGDGAEGQKGADGGAGGQGGDGAIAANRGGDSSGDLPPGDGGTGGAGGNGGYDSPGGNGGNGGDGGFDVPPSTEAGDGGTGGAGGNGGENAPGGNGGNGGSGDIPGNPGVPGDPGLPATEPAIDPNTTAACSSGRKWAGLKCAFSLVDCAGDIVVCTAAEVVTAGLATPCYIWAGVGCTIGITDDCGGAAFGKCGDGLLGDVPCGSDPYLAVAGIAFGNPPGITDAIGMALDCAKEDDDGFVSEIKIPKKRPENNKHFDFDEIPALNSFDPNEIAGPTGLDEARWVSKFDTLNFRVDFENDSMLATAAAQRVTVRVPLSSNLNPFSLRLGKFGFAGLTFDVPKNTLNYTKVLRLADSLGVDVELSAGLDIINNEAFWTFQSIDRLTGLPPTLPELGFLPINDSLGRGMGFVNYSILANGATVTGDTATAQAEIVFDINDPILTNVWQNTFDAVAPTSALNALAPTQYSTHFSVGWSGADDAGGSGVAQYELFVSENGGPFQRWGEPTTDLMATFTGTVGSTYEFYTRATDRTGNREGAKTSGDTVHIAGMTANVSTAKPSCPGSASGSATVNRTGGLAPFHYAWSAAGAGDAASVAGLAPGNYTVTVSDSNLPPLTVELEFEILDTSDLTPPTALCQNLTQSLQASDTLAHFSALSIADGSADNCGAVTISPSAFDFGCAQLGSHTVVLTIADIAGNTAACSATLTVTDANGLCDPNSDGDGDGYALEDDCDDNNDNIFPGAPELCNGLDDDCDGTTDEGVLQTFYADTDGDGLGNAAVSQMACDAPSNYVADNTDCDDTNTAIHPAASETCNGLDDDCD
ncbi:MAG: MopE-related protein, partial [Saprospiraceae bacterium]